MLGVGTALGAGLGAAGALDTPDIAGRSAAASGPDRIRSARITIANTATAATTAAAARTRRLVTGNGDPPVGLDGGFPVTNGVLAGAAPGDATTTVVASSASCSAGSTCPSGAG